MTVGAVTTMPKTGVNWVGPADTLEANGYRRNDCAWNLAWNQLHADKRGAENDPAAVQARVTELINDYNDSVPSSQRITNPNLVTSQQITAMENAYLAKHPSPPESQGPPPSSYIDLHPPGWHPPEVLPPGTQGPPPLHNPQATSGPTGYPDSPPQTPRDRGPDLIPSSSNPFSYGTWLDLGPPKISPSGGNP
jgi:hypothetical protein